MTKIIFTSAFPPMIHGIGSYTKYLVDSLYETGCDCGIISFDPYTCGFPIMKGKKVECEYPVRYTIPGCYDYHLNLIFDGLTNLYGHGDNYVFWIQYAPALASMLGLTIGEPGLKAHGACRISDFRRGTTPLRWTEVIR